MTDNEKAATFIGWPKFLINMGAGWKTERAPDMNKPEKYMEALETLDGYEIFKPIGHFPIGRVYTIRAWRGGWEGRGETAIEALAALYDVEHKQTGERDHQ